MRVMRLSGRFKPFSGVLRIKAQPLCADMQTKASSEWLEQQQTGKVICFIFNVVFMVKY